MQVEKMVCIPDQEVRVTICAEDITDILSEVPDSSAAFTTWINACAKTLKAMPAELIARLNSVQKEMIRNFLRTQAERFEEGTTHGDTDTSNRS